MAGSRLRYGRERRFLRPKPTNEIFSSAYKKSQFFLKRSLRPKISRRGPSLSRGVRRRPWGGVYCRNIIKVLFLIEKEPKK